MIEYVLTILSFDIAGRANQSAGEETGNLEGREEVIGGRDDWKQEAGQAGQTDLPYTSLLQLLLDSLGFTPSFPLLQVTQLVEKKCQSKPEINKYKLYVDELDQVTHLLLKLSGRLAKAENAVIMLSEKACEKERVSVQSPSGALDFPWLVLIMCFSLQSMLVAKRDELHAKHEDAKDLKEGIDRRSQQVATYLRKYFTADEFTDYEYFIKMKSQLTIEKQEIEDRMKQGEEQLEALRKSMGDSSCWFTLHANQTWLDSFLLAVYCVEHLFSKIVSIALKD